MFSPGSGFSPCYISTCVRVRRIDHVIDDVIYAVDGLFVKTKIYSVHYLFHLLDSYQDE